MDKIPLDGFMDEYIGNRLMNDCIYEVQYIPMDGSTVA